MKKFINIIKNKWLINTSKTVLLVIIIFAIFIGINYGVQKLDLNTIDLTENKLYSLTNESKEKIKNIQNQVDIYFFGFEEDSPYADLAKQYSKINKNIKIKIANVSQDTDLYTKYGVDSQDQGIVVACGEKSKILSSSDFYTYDYSSNQQIDLAEETFTSAILNIIADTKPRSLLFNWSF